MVRIILILSILVNEAFLASAQLSKAIKKDSSQLKMGLVDAATIYLTLKQNDVDVNNINNSSLLDNLSKNSIERRIISVQKELKKFQPLNVNELVFNVDSTTRIYNDNKINLIRKFVLSIFEYDLLINATNTNFFKKKKTNYFTIPSHRAEFPFINKSSKTTLISYSDPQIAVGDNLAKTFYRQLEIILKLIDVDFESLLFEIYSNEEYYIAYENLISWVLPTYDSENELSTFTDISQITLNDYISFLTFDFDKEKMRQSICAGIDPSIIIGQDVDRKTRLKMTKVFDSLKHSGTRSPCTIFPTDQPLELTKKTKYNKAIWDPYKEYTEEGWLLHQCDFIPDKKERRECKERLKPQSGPQKEIKILVTRCAEIRDPEEYYKCIHEIEEREDNDLKKLAFYIQHVCGKITTEKENEPIPEPTPEPPQVGDPNQESSSHYEDLSRREENEKLQEQAEAQNVDKRKQEQGNLEDEQKQEQLEKSQQKFLDDQNEGRKSTSSPRTQHNFDEPQIVEGRGPVEDRPTVEDQLAEYSFDLPIELQGLGLLSHVSFLPRAPLTTKLAADPEVQKSDDMRAESIGRFSTVHRELMRNKIFSNLKMDISSVISSGFRLDSDAHSFLAAFDIPLRRMGFSSISQMMDYAEALSGHPLMANHEAIAEFKYNIGGSVVVVHAIYYRGKFRKFNTPGKTGFTGPHIHIQYSRHLRNASKGLPKVPIRLR